MKNKAAMKAIQHGNEKEIIDVNQQTIGLTCVNSVLAILERKKKRILSSYIKSWRNEGGRETVAYLILLCPS